MTMYLKQALLLAQTYRGFCAPNPAVGAIVVKNGAIVGEGAHQAFGCAHAEVVALNQAGNLAKAADLYVTLVPCHHVGKTPPCTEAIIAAGVARVFFGHHDCGEQVSSEHSIHQLEAAGIACQYQPLAELTDFYKSYDNWCNSGLPAVTAKLALSLDGMIAARNSQKVNITGAELQKHCHQKRYHSDAVLTTITTVLNDDPQLNCRFGADVTAKAVCVLDSKLNMPMQAQLWTTAKSLTLFYDPELTDPMRLQQCSDRGAICVPVSSKQYGLCWHEIMKNIGESGVHDLWVEAGAKCFASLMAGRWLQRVWLYYGARVLGGDSLPGFCSGEDQIWQTAQRCWYDIGGEGACEFTWGDLCLQD